MIMKQIALTVVASVAMMIAGTSVAEARNNENSFGLTIGTDIGAYAQFKVSKSSYIETGLDYGFDHKELNVYATWQYYFNLATNIYGYAGGGVNVGAQHIGNEYSSADFNLGISPNIGIGYRFEKAATAVGLDYRPSINIAGHSSWNNISVKIRHSF